MYKIIKEKFETNQKYRKCVYARFIGFLSFFIIFDVIGLIISSLSGNWFWFWIMLVCLVLKGITIVVLPEE